MLTWNPLRDQADVGIAPGQIIDRGNEAIEIVIKNLRLRRSRIYKNASSTRGQAKVVPANPCSLVVDQINAVRRSRVIVAEVVVGQDRLRAIGQFYMGAIGGDHVEEIHMRNLHVKEVRYFYSIRDLIDVAILDVNYWHRIRIGAC